jgi:hypothetical protein
MLFGYDSGESRVEPRFYTERLTNTPTFSHVLSPGFHRENARASFIPSVLKCAEKIPLVYKEVDKGPVRNLNPINAQG